MPRRGRKSRPAAIPIRPKSAAAAGTPNASSNPASQGTLATGLPRELCEQINLGYRDPATIDVESFANQEDAVLGRAFSKTWRSSISNRKTAFGGIIPATPLSR